VHLSSKTLAQAARLAEQIESLEKQLDDLLQGKEISWQNQRTPKAPAKQRVSSPGNSLSSAPKARKGERRTLRPAVVEILKKIKKPLKTADIYDALVAKGYQFTFREPRKVLGIRLYKMLGVKALGEGLFKAK
jgi:hypothetical protein